MKKVLKILAWLAGSIAVLLVAVEIVLSPAVATKLVNKYASRFIDADLSFGKVHISVFRRFPNLSVRLDDAVLTYPKERFAYQERMCSAWQMAKGRGEDVDTLASFRHFDVALTLPSLIGGTIRVPRLELSHPRIFAKMYDGDTANWNIFGESDPDDTTSSSMPCIKVGRVRMSEGSTVVFCSPSDTLFAMLSLEDMSFSGKVNTEALGKTRGHLRVDALGVDGRYKADTLMVNLESLAFKGNRDKFNLDLKAALRANTHAFGRIGVPLELDVQARCPEDSLLRAYVDYLKLRLAGIPLEADGEVTMYSPERYQVDARAAIKSCRLGDVLKEYGSLFWDGAQDVKTDAILNLNATASGIYDSRNGTIPSLTANLDIPESSLKYSKIENPFTIALGVQAESNGETVNVNLRNANVESDDVLLYASGSAFDLLGRDPLVKADAGLIADLAPLMKFAPSDLGVYADGTVTAEVKGAFRMSQLDIEKIGAANIKGYIESDNLDFAMPSDSISATVTGLAIDFAAKGNAEEEVLEKNERMFTVSMALDSLVADYKESLSVRGKKVNLDAWNSASILSSGTKGTVHPFSGKLSAGSLTMTDADSTFIGIRDNSETFTIKPADAARTIPILSMHSSTSRAFMRSGANRVAVRDLNFDASAVMNTVAKNARRRAYMDSLAKSYPDIPRDSLRSMMRRRAAKAEVPEWMTEEDFKQSDLDFKLSETLAKYYKEWDINGNINLGKAAVMTPMFPLKNSVTDFRGSFNNDRVNLTNITINSGASDISASGSVWGLKRVFLSNGVLNMDVKVTSDVLDVNELMAAMSAGQKADTKKMAAQAENMDDDEYEKLVTSAKLDKEDAASHLIVVPGNVNATISLEANAINYSSLAIDWMESDIVMKERCLQITNTVATSNMGDIYFEGFYSTKTKKNIKAGFFLNLVDITSEKVIDLIPAVDSIVPMLKNFSGMLDCTLAATTSLDDKMNIVLPSLDGVLRIMGKNLEINEDDAVYKLAKTLMFRNKKTVRVKKMSVEGLVGDSRIEVFPFILDIDRYRVALSGIQGMDSSFKYHVSVIKSPLLFKFGVDLSGTFDNWKFRLGRAKYRNVKKVPVFSSVIDKSTLNLTESIHNIFFKGVDNAIHENQQHTDIQAFKDKTGYVQAVDMPLDTLSLKESKRMEEMESRSEELDSLLQKIDIDHPETIDSLTLVRLKELGYEIEDKEDDDEDAE